MEKEKLITINRADLQYIYETCKELGVQAEKNRAYIEKAEETITQMKKEIEELRKKPLAESITPMVEVIKRLKDKFCGLN